VKILLIEDNVDHAELIRKTIENEFDIYWVRSGRDGLEYLSGLTPEARPTLILLDYELPGLDGLSVLEHILKEGYDIPVIMITGHGDEEVAVKAMKEGAYDYIVKSAKILYTLPSAIHKTLEQQRAEKTKAELERELKKLSITDDLTGLFNRRYFYHRLEEEMVRAKRQGLFLSLVLVDLDDFKRYNDIHGHVEGDGVLKEVAETILHCIRDKIDSACRYGGDEFAIIMPHANKDQASAAAWRIKMAIKEAGIHGITASVGVAEYGKHGDESVEDFVRSADEVLYQAKKVTTQVQGSKVHGSEINLSTVNLEP